MKSVTLSDIEINRFKNLTKNLRHEKPHQYENIRVKDGDKVFILYNSKKLVYNDNDACLNILYKILETREYEDTSYSHNNQITNNYSVSLMDNFDFTIGSDETGKGEWYGPLVITAVSTSAEENLKLKQIGVKDSKKLSRTQILNLYEKIEKLNITHETLSLTPYNYNRLYYKFRSEGKNLNHLLAYLHSKAITNLLAKLNTDNVLVIIDKFDYKKMNDYLDLNENIKIIQESNGERYIPVATSSIIAKYHYEKILRDIEQRYNINLRKTKPEKIKKELLEKVAKTHFKNVNKYL